MKKLVAIIGLAALGLASPASGAVNGFVIVNQSGAAMRDVALRRVGDKEWRPLAVAPPAGGSVRADFNDKDCAFDLRATVEGAGLVVWSGVNLCDVKSVTLNRDRSGRRWVDYD